ncbi:hypothetical protein [Arthrobacter dokdonensis]|uniref:hypothetical protein n=1 Tax=Arthrobacter dokdonellae TaxID=2211210 RepID=UPI001013CA93|nr:hypothetical protein [Arthrobacter dokdonellae]
MRAGFVDIAAAASSLRTSFREAGKVKHETLANLSAMPHTAVETLKASLAGKTMVEAGTVLQNMGFLPRGHIETVYAMARGLGFESLLGSAGPERDAAMALLAARICALLKTGNPVLPRRHHPGPRPGTGEHR